MSKADGGPLQPGDYVYMRVRGHADDELHFSSMLEWVAAAPGGASLVSSLAAEFGLPPHLHLVRPTRAQFQPASVPKATSDAVQELVREMREPKGPDGEAEELIEHVVRRWPHLCAELDRLLREDPRVRVAGRDVLARGKPFENLLGSQGSSVSMWKCGFGSTGAVLGFAAYVRLSSILR